MQNESYEERNAHLAERLVHILPQELPAFPERERDKLILYGMAPLYGRFARDAALIAAVGRCACPPAVFFCKKSVQIIFRKDESCAIMHSRRILPGAAGTGSTRENTDTDMERERFR